MRAALRMLRASIAAVLMAETHRRQHAPAQHLMPHLGHAHPPDRQPSCGPGGCSDRLPGGGGFNSEMDTADPVTILCESLQVLKQGVLLEHVPYWCRAYPVLMQVTLPSVPATDPRHVRQANRSTFFRFLPK